MLENASAITNVAETPSFKWKTRLLGLLVNRIPAAALVVGRMKVDVSDGFAADEELFEGSLALYAKQIVAVWEASQKLPISPQEQVVFFTEFAKDLSLTYNA